VTTTSHPVSPQESTLGHEAPREQLRFLDRLASVGMLTGGIVHDLEGLFTLVSEHLEAVHSVIPVDHSAHSRLDDVERAIEHASGMIESLLDFSRQAEASMCPVLLGDVARETSRLLGRLLPTYIHQEWQISDKPLHINGDPLLLKQVLMNLTLNACEAMPDGGTLRVSVVPRHVGEEHLPPHSGTMPGTYACLIVQDCGHGINDEAGDRLGETCGRPTPHIRPIALGLAIVDRIVKEHGGWVNTDSWVGSGSTVSILFPCVESPCVSEPSVEHGQATVPSETSILVVAQDACRRTNLATILREAGHPVYQTSSHVLGMDFLRSRYTPINVLVVDDADGAEMRETSSVQSMRHIAPDATYLLIVERSDTADDVRRTWSPHCETLPRSFAPDELKLAVARLSANQQSTDR